MINARSETAGAKPPFREALETSDVPDSGRWFCANGRDRESQSALLI